MGCSFSLDNKGKDGRGPVAMLGRASYRARVPDPIALYYTNKLKGWPKRLCSVYVHKYNSLDLTCFVSRDSYHIFRKYAAHTQPFSPCPSRASFF